MTTLREATAHLADTDPHMAALIDQVGPPRLGPRRNRFEALARSIAFQQLAGAAARAIWGRAVAAMGDRVTPEAILSTPDAALRGAGLSAAKLASLRDLATKVHDGTVRLERIGRLADDAVVDHLTVVRGIGPWSAQMFLIFTLRRLDVWPTGDLGVRNGWRNLYGLDVAPTARELEALGDPFSPYRSVAAWYLWRAVDIITPA